MDGRKLPGRRRAGRLPGRRGAGAGAARARAVLPRGSGSRAPAARRLQLHGLPRVWFSDRGGGPACTGLGVLLLRASPLEHTRVRTRLQGLRLQVQPAPGLVLLQASFHQTLLCHR